MNFYIVFAALTSCLCCCQAAINAGCQCKNYRGDSEKESGVFNSPNYPRPYRDNINCILYVFEAPASKSLVEILFDDLDLGEVNQYGNCNSGDKLRVYLEQTTPSINEDASYYTQICGNLSTMRSRSFYSRTGYLILELETDGNSSPHRGFKGTFAFLNPKKFDSDGVYQANTQCTYSIHAGDRTGRLFSPQYPQNYPPNSNCAWKYRGDWNERVHISFLKIELATWGMSNYSVSSDNIVYDIDMPRTCDYNEIHNDVITVYDGGTSQAPIIGRYCGSRGPEEVRSTGSSLLVTFTSNEYGEAPGFAALFRFIKQAKEDELSSCDLNVKSHLVQRGFVHSPHYPNAYKSTTCIYRFHASPRERVAIKFQDFDLGGGEIPSSSCELRDKLVVEILVNNTYPSTLKVFCGSQLPLGVMSNGPYLQIKFEAISSNPQARGFNFEYEFVKDFGITSDARQDHLLPCANEYKADIHMKGEVISPNYPGYYPKDTLCTYYFYGRGKNVKIQFKHFDVKGYPPQCLLEMSSDFLAISNYNGAEDKKLGRFCTYTNSPSNILSKTFVSDSDFLQMTFKSGMSGNGTGFMAEYEFVEPESTTEEQISYTSGGNTLIYNHYLSLALTVYYILAYVTARCIFS